MLRLAPDGKGSRQAFLTGEGLCWMGKMLITGGTGFVSGYLARYFVQQGWQVWTLNRDSRDQMPGVTLIRADRHQLGDTLHGLRFDAVIDAVAYDAPDMEKLLAALEGQPDYVLISSSAVYPETLPQPFSEDMPVGENRIWGAYGLGKVRAEEAARRLRPDSYILRPPYLYGPMQNLYREPFVFDCATAGQPFYLPGDGSMPLQFNHIRDLCRLIDLLLDKRPQSRIYNTGDLQPVTIRQWVELCYQVVGAPCRFVSVSGEHPQRSYFPFYPYAYQLDVRRQQALLPELTPLLQGLRESWDWYRQNPQGVMKRDYAGYIAQHLAGE